VTRGSFARAGRICALLGAAAIVLSSGVVGGTHALFNGETKNANSKFADDWVDPPTGLSATLKGADVQLNWTHGTHQVSDQQVLGYDANTSSSCNSASYTAIATLGSATANTYTDSGRGSTLNGHWYCYEVTSLSTITWTPGTTLSALQVGLAASQLAIANGGTSGRIDNKDTITLTFNQQTSLATGTSTVRVCTFTSGLITIGDGNNCAGTGDATSVGTLTLSGATIGNARNFATSTLTVTSSAPWTVSVKLGGGTATTVTGTPTWTYAANAATTLKSLAGNGTQVGVCTTASTNCQPTTSTTF